MRYTFQHLKQHFLVIPTTMYPSFKFTNNHFNQKKKKKTATNWPTSRTVLSTLLSHYSRQIGNSAAARAREIRGSGNCGKKGGRILEIKSRCEYREMYTEWEWRCRGFSECVSARAFSHALMVIIDEGHALSCDDDYDGRALRVDEPHDLAVRARCVLI